MKYRFSAIWAAVHIGIGVTIIAASLGVAGLVLFGAGFGVTLPGGASGWEGLVALVIVLGGILLGSPLIVAGQLVELFLEQRRLLARVERHLRPRDDEDLADGYRVTGRRPGRRPGEDA